MRGKCECGRYGELKQGKCIICLPPDPSKTEIKWQQRLESFKKSNLRTRINKRFYVPPKKKPKKEKRIKEKEPRMIDVMREVWDEREHISFINGEPLTNFSNWKLAHILPKSYTRWKKKKFNFVLMTEGQHYLQHNEAESVLREMHPGWNRFFDLKQRYTELYNRNEEPDGSTAI